MINKLSNTLYNIKRFYSSIKNRKKFGNISWWLLHCNCEQCKKLQFVLFTDIGNHDECLREYFKQHAEKKTYRVFMMKVIE